MKNETLELAKALIRRKSITPADEGCQQIIIDRLVPLGFKAETFKCGDVTNLWIRHGTAKPLVVLAGHTDVVPPGPREKWNSDPFEPTIRDGKLFGRGAADMKTSIAAFVTAAERFVAAHPEHPGSVGLLITSDEEGPSVDGTVRVVEAFKARGEAIDFCIVGEPSSVERFGDTIKNGRRGSLTGRLTVHGVQGHVAYPQNVKNPIHLVAPAIAEISTTEWDKGNEFFPPTSFQVSNIHGGTGAQNITPGHVEVAFNFRFSTESTPESLQARVKKALDRHGLEYDLDWIVGGKPFLTKRGRLVATLTNAIRKVSGVTPEVNCTGGTSDGRFIIDVCPEVAEFGPVNRSIHKVNEAVALEEIEPLADVYRTAIEDLLLPELKTIRDALLEATQRLEQARLAYGHGTGNALDEAAWLVLHAAGLPPRDLDRHLEDPLSVEQQRAARQLVTKRIRTRKPLAYLLNEAWLGPHRFYVDERVIVPRSFIAEMMLDGARHAIFSRQGATAIPATAIEKSVPGTVLDLCTGSGCLAILAALQFREAAVDAADLSDDALAVAKKNIADYKLGKRVRLVKSDLFAGLEGRRYDFIVSNPPYVKAASMRTLPDEYRKEPAMALASGSDGLDHTRRILAEARRHLNPAGRLMVEIGHNRKALEKCFPRLPFRWPRVAAGTGYVFMLERDSLP